MSFDTPAFRVGEASAGNNPVYVYRFDWNDTRFPNKMGAFHALDIAFVFGAMDPDLELARILASHQTYVENMPLALRVMGYYANFAKTGDPNGPGLPEWPAYEPGTRQRLYIDTETQARPLTELEVQRFQYYAAHSMGEILSGDLAGALGGEK
jgi:para-nitrobenzyl esterase